MLDSVIRANKKNYPKTLLEECKYEIKKEQNGEPWRMMIWIQVHLMNLIVNLIVNLIMNLIMYLIMMNLVINLIMIMVKTVF